MVTTDSADELKVQLAKLDVAVRAEIARFLFESLSDHDVIDVDARWEAELDRRVEEMRSGKVKGIPAGDVIAEIRAKFS